MFGPRYFGPRYFGPRYFGVGAAAVATQPARAIARGLPRVRVTVPLDPDRAMTPTRLRGLPVDIEPLELHNARAARAFLEIWDDEENAYLPWDDATNVEVAYCSDDDGTTVIDNMGPFAMTAVDAVNQPGWFAAAIPTSVIDELDDARYRGRLVFERITAGASNEVARITPLRVTAPALTKRRPA